jgi:hypothetical protein
MSRIIDVAEKQNKDSISKPRNGLGTFVYPDGRIYVGEFKNGKRNGEGTLTRPEGKVQKGYWENSKLVA